MKSCLWRRRRKHEPATTGAGAAAGHDRLQHDGLVHACVLPGRPRGCAVGYIYGGDGDVIVVAETAYTPVTCLACWAPR